MPNGGAVSSLLQWLSGIFSPTMHASLKDLSLGRGLASTVLSAVLPSAGPGALIQRASDLLIEWREREETF